MFTTPAPMLFDLLARLAILLGIAILCSLILIRVHRYVERRRKSAQVALPLLPVPLPMQQPPPSTEKPASHVRILVFSSAQYPECHMYQLPALRRVAEIREDIVTIVEIDAPKSPQLTERYQVVTLPTTVIMDEKGNIYAVNHGFANAHKLFEQVDAVVAHSIRA